MTKPSKTKLSSVLSGIAGEYFVAAELTRRGFIASITLRNTRGIDILATPESGGQAIEIQVKTSQSEKWWLLSKACEEIRDPGRFYVFVRLLDDHLRPEFYIVPSRVVAVEAKERHLVFLNKPRSKPIKDTAIREFHDETGRFLERWDLLGVPEQASVGSS
ncbi:hypothetical protein D3C72_132340 [compost metagenome]